MKNHQYIRDLKIGPMKIDARKEGCFSVMFEFYPKEADPKSSGASLNKNPDPNETHRQIGQQLLELMDAVRAAKNPEKYLRTHGDRQFTDPSNN